MKKSLSLISIILLLTSCGTRLSGDEKTSGPDVVNKSDIIPEGHNWTIVSAHCENGALTTLDQERYQFDSGLIAHISTASDTLEVQCVEAIAYSRVYRSVSMMPYGDYKEECLLKPTAKRTVCRKKVNGKPVDPPISDTTEPLVSNELEMTLSITPSWTMVLKLKGDKRCDGETTINLAVKP